VLKLGIVYGRKIQNLVSVGDVEACQGAPGRDTSPAPLSLGGGPLYNRKQLDIKEKQQHATYI
jgi:hypothetical protein